MHPGATILAGLVAGLAFAQPALAQGEGACRGDSRALERDLTFNADRLSPSDRLQAEQRLGRADTLCTQDPGRGSRDLEQLRRDIIQQAQRPQSPQPWRPGPPNWQ